MKRLFCIRSSSRLVRLGSTDLATLSIPESPTHLAGFFADKPTAKRVRDHLGGAAAGYRVAPGPDHWRHS